MAGGVLLWLCLLGWLTEALVAPRASVCDLAPCQCARGKLLCNCTGHKLQDLVLRDLGELGFGSISVSHCARVAVEPRALAGLTGLQQVSVSHVGRLDLAEAAFSWPPPPQESHPQHGQPQQQPPGPAVSVTRTAVPLVPSYCFHGALREIVFDAVNVSRVQAFAFAAIDGAERMEFAGVRFGAVEPQAFKKFGVDRLAFADCEFGELPTRTMVDAEVRREAEFERVTIGALGALALKIHGCRRFRLARSTVGRCERHALHVRARGSVSVADNAFGRVERGAFAALAVERRHLREFGKQELAFENNTLADFEPGALTFDTAGFSPRLDWITVGRRCACDGDGDDWASGLVRFASSADGGEPAAPAGQVAGVLHCRGATDAVVSVRDFRRLFCRSAGGGAVGAGVLVALFATAGCVLAGSLLTALVCWALRGRARPYANVPNSPSPLKGPSLVVPDGKTYRETELHVIVERAEPIAPAAAYAGAAPPAANST